jgi:hypothetical protein
VFTKRGELFGPGAQDTLQAVRGFGNARADRVPRRRRPGSADAGQPGDFVGAGPVEVERPGVVTGAGGRLARIRAGEARA